MHYVPDEVGTADGCWGPLEGPVAAGTSAGTSLEARRLPGVAGPEGRRTGPRRSPALRPEAAVDQMGRLVSNKDEYFWVVKEP